jgi:hypothetical protein
MADTDEGYRTVALREIEGRLSRLHRIEHAMKAVDDQDWDYLKSKLGDGGRDRFWKEVIRDLRVALQMFKP